MMKSQWDYYAHIRWFGPESWGAPVCEPEDRIPIPIGSSCFLCLRPIEDADHGISQMAIDDDGVWHVPSHLNCFSRSLGIQPPP